MRDSPAFIRFSRPHTIIATTIQAVSMFLLAAGPDFAAPGAPGVLLIGLLASLALNIYIVGINQITDVAIDRLNKPYLPLAAGDYSMQRGRAIVLLAGLLALLLAFARPPYLTLTIGAGFLIGTFYSLRPLRFKERALWAALSIAFVRGVLTTVGLFLYYRQALQLAVSIPPLIASAAVFFFGFGLVIALYKDIPDVEGDRRYTVRTFTVRLGAQRVFSAGRWLLTVFYLFPAGYLVWRLPHPAALTFLLAHIIVLAAFWGASLRIDPAQQRQMSRFYLGLWLIFYIEYFLLVAYRLAAGSAA